MVDSLDSMHLCSWRLHFVENISEAKHVTALCDVVSKKNYILLCYYLLALLSTKVDSSIEMRRVHVQVGSKRMGINICTSTSTCTRHPRHQHPVLVSRMVVLDVVILATGCIEARRFPKL